MALFFLPCFDPFQQFLCRFIAGGLGDEGAAEGAGEEEWRELVHLPLGLAQSRCGFDRQGLRWQMGCGIWVAGIRLQDSRLCSEEVFSTGWARRAARGLHNGVSWICA